MQRTFSYRRQEILQEPMITEVRNRWPALFEIGEVNLEFMCITTIPLISKFIGQLDKYTDGLMKVFRHKGGCAGQKIRTIMALTAKDTESVEAESLMSHSTDNKGLLGHSSGERWS